MRKLLIGVVTLLAFTGFTAGIAYANGSAPECEEGEMCITTKGAPQPTSANSTSSSAGATVGVGPNGTDYRAEIAVTGKSCVTGNATDSATQQDWVVRESYPEQHTFKFTGTMVTANPCVTVDHEFDERNGTYVLDVITQPGEGACTQCVGMVTYNATVDATTSYFQLEVKHNGETVKTFAPPQEENTSGLNPGADNESESGEVEQPKKGIFSGIFNWFRSFF